jgi:hypothetical protein
MAVIESPTDLLNQAQVDRSFAALRASVKPWDWTSLDGILIGGHYSMYTSTGLTTVIAAPDPIFSFRWTDVQLRAMLLRIRAFVTITTAFGTAQEVSLRLNKVVNFLAADTGGTALVPIGDLNRKTTVGMNPSRVADMRVATTAALTAGTATSDGNLGFCVFPGLLNVIGSMSAVDLYNVSANGECPIILNANQGFRINMGFTQGATGVMRFSFVIDWAEIPAV